MWRDKSTILVRGILGWWVATCLDVLRNKKEPDTPTAPTLLQLGRVPQLHYPQTHLRMDVPLSTGVYPINTTIRTTTAIITTMHIQYLALTVSTQGCISMTQQSRQRHTISKVVHHILGLVFPLPLTLPYQSYPW